MRARLGSSFPTIVGAVLLAIALSLIGAFWFTLQIRFETPVMSPQEAYWVGLFDLNGEGNIPAWYGSTLWSMSALLSWVASARGHERRFGFIALGVIFMLLSLDESAAFHESFSITDWAFEGSGFIAWPWVLVGFAFLAIVSLIFGRFVLSLARPIAALFIVAAGIFAAGALGMEAYGAAVSDGTLTFPAWLNWGRAVAIEEGLEMLGVILNVVALLHYLRLSGVVERETPP